MTSHMSRVVCVVGSFLVAPCLGFAQDVTPPGGHTHPHSDAQEAQTRADRAAAAAQSAKKLEIGGKVSDVWEAKVRKHGSNKDNKIVLVETDQGQIVLADLGPANQVSVKEGEAALVVGQVQDVGGTKRFVPERVRVGKNATAAMPGSTKTSVTKAKQPERQQVTGKVVDKEKMSAKSLKIDHQLAVLEIAPGELVLVDLGPSAQLEAVDIDEGDRLTIDGQNVLVNESFVLVADKVEKGDKSVKIQHQALPRGQAGEIPGKLAPAPESE